jgi:hypothetical protein
VAKEIAESSVLALLTIDTRRVVQYKPLHLTIRQEPWQITNHLGAMGASSVEQGHPDPASASSKRTGSQLVPARTGRELQTDGIGGSGVWHRVLVRWGY